MRPLVLVGAPGSGSSELADLVAKRIHARVQTVDAAGLARLLDSETLEPTIFDVASEAWLDRATRVRALDRCVVVGVESLGRDGARTASNGAASDVDLWAHLTVPFRESHQVVSGLIESREASVEKILDLWRRDPIAVAVGEQSYVVDIGHGIFAERCSKVLQGATATLVVTDSNVDRLYGERLVRAVEESGTRVVRTVFEAGEAHKHLGTLQGIFEQAQRDGIDRSCRVLAFGGGVVTDIGGFAAATWMRGISWISVPTTLLGMVDASVGGKTAVDLGEGKNAVGAFWQPSGVICDVEWLLSETNRNYSSALAEVVKTALIGDPELFEVLERECAGVLSRDVRLMAELVRRCIRVKARIVGLDEREQGLRAVLNLGHTIGHALEASAGLGSRTHGEAVSLGLVAACRLGVRHGVTPAELERRVVALLTKLGLPMRLQAAELRAAAEIVGLDKKRKGSSVKFVFARGIGEVSIQPVVLEDLRTAMPDLAG